MCSLNLNFPIDSPLAAELLLAPIWRQGAISLSVWLAVAKTQAWADSSTYSSSASPPMGEKVTKGSRLGRQLQRANPLWQSHEKEPSGVRRQTAILERSRATQFGANYGDGRPSVASKLDLAPK